MNAAALIASFIGAAIALLGAVVTVVLFAGRLSTSLEHLADAVRDLSKKIDTHETRLSHVEGRLGRRATDA